MPPRAAKKSPAGPAAALAKRKAAKASPKPPVTAEAAAEAAAKIEAAAAAAAEAQAAADSAAAEAEAAAEAQAAAEAEAAMKARIEEEVKNDGNRAEEIEEAADAEAKDHTNNSIEEDNEDQFEAENQEPEEEADEETALDYDGQEEDSEGEEIVEEGDVVEEDEEAEMLEEDMEDVEEGGEDVEGVEEEEEDREHDEVVKERRKRKEFEVFIGGLDKDVTRDDLVKVFKEVGEVTDVRLMMNPQTNKNRGFAFLRFATVEQAKRAVSEMKTAVVKGKQCGVSPSQDSDTLFVGNICKTWTKEFLKEKLKGHGIENIEDITLVEDASNKGLNRGFAFLEFSSRTEALTAFKCLRKMDALLGTDRAVKVSFANSFIEPDDEVMAQVKTIFLDGLPASWDEERVKELLNKYGAIKEVDLARNMLSAKRKDFGFVSFDTHDNAVACVDGINSVDLGEGDNKVKVRARLARPRQRGGGSFGMGRGPTRGGRGGSRGVLARYGTGRVSHGGHAPIRRPIANRLPSRLPRASRDYERPVQSHEFRKPIGFRGRRPIAAMEERPRRMPPLERPYARRPPIPAYPKSNSKRGIYARRDDPPPRSRPTADYVSNIPIKRHPSYVEDYPSRRSDYSDVAPRGDSHSGNRRAYADEGYRQTHEKPLLSHQGNRRDYAPVSRSKRPYSELDDAPRYSSVNTRQTRPRLDYEAPGSASHYADTYVDRLERYGSRRTISDQDGLYKYREGPDYDEGSYSRNVGSGLYSTSLSSRYASDGSNVGGSSYSSMYSGRNLGGSSYPGSTGRGSSYH